jgi:hypothetical protein
MKCKFNDCGWCYAPAESDSNDSNGACKYPDECTVLEDQIIHKATNIYCPICAKNIEASNVDAVQAGLSDGFVFVHDDIDHGMTDIEALENGIN